MFMLMLRCGLRVEEVARLTADAIEYRSRQLYVFNGKGSKDRVVYLSEDAQSALKMYMQKRKWSKEKRVFLVQKGPLKGKPISVRGIQKRIEHYAQRAGIRGILSSFETHYGNPAVKCGCRSRYHSGSTWPQPDYYNPVLL